MSNTRKEYKDEYLRAKKKFEEIDLERDAIIKEATREIDSSYSDALDVLEDVRERMCSEVDFCEHCEEPIFEGDQYAPIGEGMVLCYEHAPMLSDVEKYLADLVNGGEGDELRNHEDVVSDLATVRATLAAHGDRKAVYFA